MAASTISVVEDFIREQFGHAIEECRPIGPTAKAILNTLMTETASHVSVTELNGSKAPDPNH